MEGTVKWFHKGKGYGFIGCGDGPDVFVHYSGIVGDGYRTLKEGDHVIFDIVQGPGGLQAANVTKEGGLRARRGGTPIHEKGVKVEALYRENCPSHPAAVALVKYVLATQNIEEQVIEVLVKDEEMARELKFHGSPTIRINGRDIAGESKTDTATTALCCRSYTGSLRIGLPPVDLVHRAVLAAQQQ